MIFGGFVIYLTTINDYKLIKDKENQAIKIGTLQEKLDDISSIVQQNDKENMRLQEQLVIEKDNNAKILSQKKSSECKLGKISENLVPFLSECPYNPSDMIFLGQPLDYLVFDLDQGEIIFLEVKSGGSKLSKKQRLLRDLIKTNKVYYEEMRVGSKGIKIKRENNDE